MYKLPTPNYLQRNLLMNQSGARVRRVVGKNDHRKRVMRELKNVGISMYGLSSMEAKYLPKVIHPDEHIGGAVFGYHKDGVVMLVATETRIVFLDKKPLFVNQDNITYDVVSGVSFSHAGFGTTMILHTRIKDIGIRTLNEKSAEHFMAYIDNRCIEHEHAREGHYD